MARRHPRARMHHEAYAHLLTVKRADVLRRLGHRGQQLFVHLPGGLVHFLLADPQRAQPNAVKTFCQRHKRRVALPPHPVDDLLNRLRH